MESLVGWINNSIISIGIWIVSGVYSIAANAFEVFLILSSGHLLDSDDYETIITNFYIILGVVMLFIFAFTLLRSMVNPEDQKQGTSTVKKVIINLVTSSIILAVLPTIFSFAFDFQDAFIMEQNTIGKFFGYGSIGSNKDSPVTETNLERVKRGAYQIVNGVFTAFLNVEPRKCSTTLVNCQQKVGGKTGAFLDGEFRPANFKDYIDYVDQYGNFNVYGAFAESVDNGDLYFDFLLSLIAGLMLIYVAVSYCFDMALRLVKLVFYQLIAPIPVFFRIIPEGKLNGIFNNWLKVTFACYLEVYIRILIFYFCIFICKAILDSDLFISFSEFGFLAALIANAFLLLGIVMFMKQAPKIFSEVTGIDSGNMKLGIKDKFKEAISAIPGAMAVGTLAKKAISGIDAQRNGQKFSDGWRRIEGTGPLSKIKKFRNSLLPYSAANAENRRKAEEQRNALHEKFEAGKDALSKFRSESNNSKAEAKDYIKSLKGKENGKYDELVEIFENRSTAKGNMSLAKAEYESLQNMSDEEFKAKFKNRTRAQVNEDAFKLYNQYKDSYESYDEEWKQLIGSSKFKKVNDKYSSMKYYEDRIAGLKPFPETSSDEDKNESQNKGYTANRNKTEQPEIIIPPSYGGARKDPDLERQRKQVDMNTYNQLRKQFDSATTTEERAKIRKQLEYYELGQSVNYSPSKNQQEQSSIIIPPSTNQQRQSSTIVPPSTNQQGQSSIIIPPSTNQQGQSSTIVAPDNSRNTKINPDLANQQNQDDMNTYNQLRKQFDNATTLEEKEKIRQQIKDFEQNH